MRIDNIEILNFKNISSATLHFSPRINCLLGMNGMGKSNLMEAIHMLCLTRPFISVPENNLIRHGEEMLLIKGDFMSDTATSDIISCGITKGKPKSFKVNSKPYTRISEHIGRYPVITVSPNDSRMISESGEERRKLMDIIISQGRRDYLPHLIRYNHALDSRNKMLRAGLRDALLYEAVETTMAEEAILIHRLRKEWTEEMRPIISEYYLKISAGSETADISYRSSMNDSSFSDLISQTREKDHILGFTSKGIHRDDIEMQLDGYGIRKLGSQGQIKTFTIAVRLAMFDYLKKNRVETPILLLDDIFDKLDAERVGRIMEIVSTDRNFGQIFITDTNRKHLDEILKHIVSDKQLLEVRNGVFYPIATA